MTTVLLYVEHELDAHELAAVLGALASLPGQGAGRGGGTRALAGNTFTSSPAGQRTTRGFGTVRGGNDFGGF